MGKRVEGRVTDAVIGGGGPVAAEQGGGARRDVGVRVEDAGVRSTGVVAVVSGGVRGARRAEHDYGWYYAATKGRDCAGGAGGFEHAKCLDTSERIARACNDDGKPWGNVPRGNEYAQRMKGWGCRMFVLGFDIHAFHAGIRAAKERYAPFFGGG